MYGHETMLPSVLTIICGHWGSCPSAP